MKKELQIEQLMIAADKRVAKLGERAISKDIILSCFLYIALLIQNNNGHNNSAINNSKLSDKVRTNTVKHGPWAIVLAFIVERILA